MLLSALVKNGGIFFSCTIVRCVWTDMFCLFIWFTLIFHEAFVLFLLTYQPKFLMQKSEQRLFKKVWPNQLHISSIQTCSYRNTYS